MNRATGCLLLQAEATRSVQIQVSDLQEQLRSQKTMTDEAVEARREGEVSVKALSKTIRERDAQVASAKVSPHNLGPTFAAASSAMEHTEFVLVASTLHIICQL